MGQHTLDLICGRGASNGCLIWIAIPSDLAVTEELECSDGLLDPSAGGQYVEGGYVLYPNSLRYGSSSH